MEKQWNLSGVRNRKIVVTLSRASPGGWSWWVVPGIDRDLTGTMQLGSTVSQQHTHPARDGLRKDVIIKLVKKIFSVRPAVEEIGNPISNRTAQRAGLPGAASCGRRRGTKPYSGVCLVTQCHGRSLIGTKTPTVCNIE